MKIIKDINVEKVLFTLPEKDEDGYYISRCEYDKDKES